MRTVQFPADPARNVSYTYDSPAVSYGIGRLTGRSDPSGSYAFHYDARGNLVKEEKLVSGVLYTTRYTWNGNSSLSSITYPSGRSVTFTRNELDRISRVETTLGGVTKTLAASIGYVPFGDVADLAYGNGLSLARDYDNQYRVSPIEVAGALGLTCQYYADGNVKTIEDALGPGGAIPEDSAVYAYETVSNRLVHIEGAASTDVGSDANGNITSDGQRTLVYDPLNQLVRVLEGASVIADYVYNALGERIIKVAEGATTVYHYDVKGRLIAETNQAGATLAECHR